MLRSRCSYVANRSSPRSRAASPPKSRDLRGRHWITFALIMHAIWGGKMLRRKFFHRDVTQTDDRTGVTIWTDSFPKFLWIGVSLASFWELDKQITGMQATYSEMECRGFIMPSPRETSNGMTWHIMSSRSVITTCTEFYIHFTTEE